jgi:hypothetical protein
LGESEVHERDGYSGWRWRGQSGTTGLFLFLSPIRNKQLLYCKTVLTTNDTNRTPPLMSDARRHGRRAFKALMRSHHLKIPKYDLPLRFRPVSPPPSPRPTHILITLFLRQWFVVLTFLIMLSLAFLGLTNFTHALPLNDKLLHFFCLGIATGVFYFIFDVEE